MAKRGRKPSIDLSGVSCPHQECNDFHHAGTGNIVGNGTYSTRDGQGRRFICKSCGGSFCLKSGTIFEGLRTPEEKVIQALKLLAKGMTLRKAAEIIDVKPETLRQWLHLMVERQEEVNRRLIQEPGVLEAELQALWEFVKNDGLRERAVRWRQKCGWWQGWPRRSTVR